MDKRFKDETNEARARACPEIEIEKPDDYERGAHLEKVQQLDTSIRDLKKRKAVAADSVAAQSGDGKIGPSKVAEGAESMHGSLKRS